MYNQQDAAVGLCLAVDCTLPRRCIEFCTRARYGTARSLESHSWILPCSGSRRRSTANPSVADLDRRKYELLGIKH
jgi:hypothetical protein